MTDIKLEDIVKEEVNSLVESLKGQISDPAQKQAIAAMTFELGMIPLRLAKGENVDHIIAALKAEAAMRGVAASLKAQTTVQQAWMNIVLRILTKVLLTAAI